ncbi:MAG: leucyl aminopeptidase [Bacteroidia bacterium]|nr:leucyl aminopeptidase [Bacteroidia bacterium]MDW8333172.1 leucyl aminopeptidase [Bacteroidia bacterium]
MKVVSIQELDLSNPVALLRVEGEKRSAKLFPADLTAALPFESSSGDEPGLYVTRGYHIVVSYLGKSDELTAEKLRKAVHDAVTYANKRRFKQLQIVFLGTAELAPDEPWAEALAVTPHLSAYEFNRHKTEPKNPNTLETVEVLTDAPDFESWTKTAEILGAAVSHVRDMVNEPPNVMTASELARQAVAAGQKHGFSVEVFSKAQIEELRMGGLLAVNRGSAHPPVFIVMEYGPREQKPIVLVGKGVVFDSGGLSLKPTLNSMDQMKSDMAGAATVIGAISAAAAAKLPLRLVGLIPATDNRPGFDAYTPCDVVTISNGATVEVLNTDAEGRMILADALVYARRYEPELVMDFATLTGAACVALGTQAAAWFSTASEADNQRILDAAKATYERVVALPLWDEYQEQLKSDVADLKNVGGQYGGAITGAKFLQYFVAYPWMHFDIAPTAFLDKAQSYRPKGATGYGVRLIFEFLKRRTQI